MTIASWNGHDFTVTPSVIYGVTAISIKGASDTEDKTFSDTDTGYVKRKSSKPMEISLTVELHMAMGCPVQAEAMALVADANDGKENYFYVGGKKLVTCQLMLTEANVEQMKVAANGEWTYAKVQLSFKQSTKMDGSTGTASSGGSSSGSKKTTTTSSAETKKESSSTSALIEVPKAAIQTTGNAISTVTDTAANAVKTVVNAAKAASGATTTGKSSGSTTSKSSSTAGTFTQTAKAKTTTVAKATTTAKKNSTDMMM